MPLKNPELTEFTTTSPVVASYTYLNLLSGEGVISYYPTIAEDNSFKEYILNSQTLISASTTGLISSTFPYKFKGLGFKIPQTIKGTAHLSGFADYTSAGGIIASAKVSVESGTQVFGGLGEIEWTSDAEVSEAGAGLTLKKTIVIDGYVNKTTLELKSAGGNLAYATLIYRYGGENHLDIAAQDTTSTSYVTKTFTHANEERFVNKIEVWMESPTDTAFVKNVKVYEELTSGMTTTDISSTITSATMAVDQGVSLKIPLTETTLATGDRIVLTFTKSGGVGNFIVDPTAEFTTNQTLKLDIPFNLEL